MQSRPHDTGHTGHGPGVRDLSPEERAFLALPPEEQARIRAERRKADEEEAQRIAEAKKPAEVVLSVTTEILRKVTSRGRGGAVVKFSGSSVPKQSAYYVVYREIGTTGWTQHGGAHPHLPFTVTIARLDPSRQYLVGVRAADWYAGVIPLSFGEEEADAERQRVQEDNERREREDRERREAERKQRELEEAHAREQADLRERRHREFTARQEEIAQEEAERQEKIRHGNFMRARLNDAYLSVSVVSQSPRGLTTFKLEAKNAMPVESFYIDERPVGGEGWTRVSRNHRSQAGWVHSELPAIRRRWVRSGDIEVRLVGWSKYGSVYSEIIQVAGRS